MSQLKSSDEVLGNSKTLLAHERIMWAKLSATWKDLPEPTLLIPIRAGGWSIKDVMNHIAAWQEAARRVVGDLLAGRFARLGLSPHNFNQRSFELDKHKPLTLTRQRSVKSRRELLKLWATVPTDMLSNEYGRQRLGWWAQWCTYGHYQQHLADLTSFHQYHFSE
jgi:hypothetical protein